MVLDGYHSDFKELQGIRRMEYGTIWAGATLSQTGAVDGNRVVSGTFTNVPYLVAENYNNDRRAHLDSVGYNIEFYPSDKWALDSDLSWSAVRRSEEHTSELQSPCNLVCRLLLEKKNNFSHAWPVAMMTPGKLSISITTG